MAPRPRLLKLSGEALKGGNDNTDGIFAAAEVDRVCGELVHGMRGGRPVAVVVGGGNIMRGAAVAQHMADIARGDYMGMLATQINALALLDGIERAGGSAVVVGPQHIANVAEAYDRQRVLGYLAAGRIVIFGGGTGHPFFTTDTCAALRAAEIEAEEVLKGSNVDGIYSADPRTNPNAERFTHLTFDQAIEGRYGVMDSAAFSLCRDRDIAIRVFDMRQEGSIIAALSEHPPGTVVSNQTT